MPVTPHHQQLAQPALTVSSAHTRPKQKSQFISETKCYIATSAIGGHQQSPTIFRAIFKTKPTYHTADDMVLSLSASPLQYTTGEGSSYQPPTILLSTIPHHIHPNRPQTTILSCLGATVSYVPSEKVRRLLHRKHPLGTNSHVPCRFARHE